MSAVSEFGIDVEEMERLASAAADGDREALERLLGVVRPVVLARCGRFLPNRDDAEEASQEALLAIARRIESFEGNSRFATWMFRVTTNAAIDCYRRLKRRRSILEDPADLHTQPHSPRGAALSVVVGARIDILEAADAVDARFSEPVLLRDLCDLDYDQIGRALSIPEGTAKSRVHKGRSLMRPHLRP